MERGKKDWLFFAKSWTFSFYFLSFQIGKNDTHVLRRLLYCIISCEKSGFFSPCVDLVCSAIKIMYPDQILTLTPGGENDDLHVGGGR